MKRKVSARPRSLRSIDAGSLGLMTESDTVRNSSSLSMGPCERTAGEGCIIYLFNIKIFKLEKSFSCWRDIIKNIIIKYSYIQVVVISNTRLLDLFFCAEGIPQYSGIDSIVRTP